MTNAEKDIADLKEFTRAAHEAAQELKDAIKNTRLVLDRMAEVKEDLIKVSESVFDQRMEATVSSQLQGIQHHVELATEAVYNRFDTLSRVMLGKGKDIDIEHVVATLHQDGELPIVQRP